MAGIPNRDLDQIHEYAARQVPPELQDQIRMEVDIRGRTVTIFERRPPWREDFGPEWTREGVARMKYDAESKRWTLYWSDSNERWHIFGLITPGTIEKILREVEQDRTNIFWG
ncbi:MAG: DUF3024 domain-containing protein [Acidimicrobiales bacterium]